MKKTIFFALLCVLSLNLAYADSNQSMKSDQMIKKAQATNKIAIKLKNEWRDTRKLIKSAKKAHANKDYAKAAIEFEKAAALNPLDYANLENAATANYLINKFDKALEQIDKVIDELNPLNGKCEYIKALIFIKMQDPIGACPLLETSIKSGFSQSESLLNQYCNY